MDTNKIKEIINLSYEDLDFENAKVINRYYTLNSIYVPIPKLMNLDINDEAKDFIYSILDTSDNAYKYKKALNNGINFEFIGKNGAKSVDAKDTEVFNPFSAYFVLEHVFFKEKDNGYVFYIPSEIDKGIIKEFIRREYVNSRLPEDFLSKVEFKEYPEDRWNEKISAAIDSFNMISRRILNKNSNKINFLLKG